ncbi:OsmC family protein [Cytobacillus oceanisediminis]|uniref:OsmC family protein n=1 Tax=Cytobacillus oceanisediminis TaxID=665099 RepID=UPI001C217994|nr:OsmC family protein [Cytobacillus oceanisediminis]MBU8728621.1 OsmC family protein [Cytobacillus oceanisediminis]MCM3402519.1 OsmC family protein [Cytobacillus oceanisediminis]MDK7667480.1 OsmC family protein [Cytobacillus oceanisediminis]
MAEHQFQLKAYWPGLRNDVGEIETGGLKTKVSIPPEMEGPGIGTNPDEMLLGAAATCYIITLAAMMERSKLEKENLTMESTGIVDVTKGVITYKKIIHRPVILLRADATEKDHSLARKLAQKAEASCMISRAIKGNVEVELEETILTAKNPSK